jgi:hypothetical protein
MQSRLIHYTDALLPLFFIRLVLEQLAGLQFGTNSLSSGQFIFNARPSLSVCDSDVVAVQGVDAFERPTASFGH